MPLFFSSVLQSGLRWRETECGPQTRKTGKKEGKERRGRKQRRTRGGKPRRVGASLRMRTSKLTLFLSVCQLSLRFE